MYAFMYKSMLSPIELYFIVFIVYTSMKKFNSSIHYKNILIFGIEAYKLRFIGEAECLIKWIIKENDRKGIKENYGFLTIKCSSQIPEIVKIERDLLVMINLLELENKAHNHQTIF